MGVWEENYFGGDILVKIYDKSKGNTSFFKEFLKDHASLQGGFVTCCRLRQSAVVLHRVARMALPPPSPLRTVHAIFTAHGSSLSKAMFT